VEHYTDPIVRFSDVCPSDYFGYGAAYLFDRSIISGYADGTFRPYNSTTRAQASKIMVLAAEWPIYIPPTPTFTDVPTTNPFYQYVEMAYHWFIVSGYSDGTFRPNSPVTRAQLSKMLFNAWGWTECEPLTPTFSDVPTTHPFYWFIETAFCNCVIFGYADGTFRPANSATRGQVSRIVYKSLIGPDVPREKEGRARPVP
jgi:hypothetical protein